MRRGKVDTKNYSQGVAFVEFTEHQHALVALRVLNSNPERFGPKHRPIVEFAVDNIQTLKLRKARIHGQQQQNDESYSLYGNPKKMETSRRRKSNGDIGELKDLYRSEEDEVANGIPHESAKHRAGKKQKCNPASTRAEVLLRENLEGKTKGSKRKQKDCQDGRKPDAGNSDKGKMTTNDPHKSSSSKKSIFSQCKRKQEDQTQKHKEDKSMKQKRPKKSKDPPGEM